MKGFWVLFACQERERERIKVYKEKKEKLYFVVFLYIIAKSQTVIGKEWLFAE